VVVRPREPSGGLAGDPAELLAAKGEPGKDAGSARTY
jgi:hypothetical protein